LLVAANAHGVARELHTIGQIRQLEPGSAVTFVPQVALGVRRWSLRSHILRSLLQPGGRMVGRGALL
jgi:hypothetical protein